MRVFLSWSGDRSRRIAEAIHHWLPAVIQAVRPYFTPEDIAKGARWNSSIAAELEDSRIGLICVTPENLDAAWIMFEAGALAKNLGDSRVCPILFGVQPSELVGPLVQFQAAPFTEADMRAVVGMVNDELADAALDKQVLDNVFKMWWPRLQAEVERITNQTPQTRESPPRADRELLEEILELSRNFVSSRGVVSISAKAVDEIVLAIGELLEDAEGKDAIRPLYNSFRGLTSAIESLIQSAMRENPQYRKTLQLYYDVTAEFARSDPKDRFELDGASENYGAE